MFDPDLHPPSSYRWGTQPAEPDGSEGVLLELFIALVVALTVATLGGLALGALLTWGGMAS